MFVVNNATVVATAHREVCCEKCGIHYQYMVRRRGLSLALPGMKNAAEAKAAALLKNAIEPVSCPGCGWLPTEMVMELHKQYGRPVKVIGKFLATTSGVLAVACATAGMTLGNGMASDLAIDWYGISILDAGGVGLGVGLMLARSWMAEARYGDKGFVSEQPVGRSKLRVLDESRIAA